MSRVKVTARGTVKVRVSVRPVGCRCRVRVRLGVRVGAGARGRGVLLTVFGPVTRHDALHVLLRPDGEALERRAAQILDVAWRDLARGLGGRA